MKNRVAYEKKSVILDNLDVQSKTANIEEKHHLFRRYINSQESSRKMFFVATFQYFYPLHIGASVF